MAVHTSPRTRSARLTLLGLLLIPLVSLAGLWGFTASITRGTGQQVGGGEVRQTIIELETAFLFVMAAGRGTCLAVLASADANLGVMAYEMAMLVRRMGTYLTAAPRSAGQDPTAR